VDYFPLFCFVSAEFHPRGSEPLPYIVTSLGPDFLFPKSFSCNIYGFPRKCCKQKTYVTAKTFRCNIYKKQGVGVSFPLWNSPHSVHFPFFSYTYGNPILQPVSFHIHAGMGDTLTSPIFPFKRSTSNGLQTYPFSFHTLAHSLARSKTQLICFQAIAHSLPQNTRGGGRGRLAN
jgi:hypothetical protein